MAEFIRNKCRLWLRCHKKKYRTPAKAKKAMRRYVGPTSQAKSRRCFDYYWCDDCEAYHLTSRKRRIKQTGENDG